MEQLPRPAYLEGRLTPEELAARYNTTTETLRGWRYKRKGPKFFRAGKRIFYRMADVEAWEKDGSERASA